MNNGGNPRKRVTHQRDIAVGCNTSALTLSLVLPKMSPTLINGSKKKCFSFALRHTLVVSEMH